MRFRPSSSAQQEEVQTLIASNEAELADIQSQIDENAELLQQLQAQAAEQEREESRHSAGSSRLQNSGVSAISPPPAGGNVVTGNGYFTHPCPRITTYQSSYFR